MYVETVHEAAPQRHAGLGARAGAVEVPLLPHGGLAAQPPWGSTPPPTLATGPASAGTAQDWHGPHDAEVQQTPSTQELS